MGQQGQKGAAGALPEPDMMVCVGNRQNSRCLSPQWATDSIGIGHIEFIELLGQFKKSGPFSTSMPFADLAKDE